MTHLRRIAMPKTFPIRRKGREKYLASAFTSENAIPIIAVLRDMIGIAKTRREVLILLRNSAVLINGKKTLNERLALHIFDKITIPAAGKYYRILLKKGKFAVEEIDEKDAGTRICKIINKTKINKGKIQFNLDNGYNILSDMKAKVNDSVIFDFKSWKVTKHLPFEEKAYARITGGRHAGEEGTISKINGNNAEIKINKGTVAIPVKNIFVAEK